MSESLLVPASMSLKALLDDLRSDSLQMAIVVDEFGAVDGVVTIEDLLEELVGDLQDEHDVIGARVLPIGEGAWEVSGLLRPDELAEATDIYVVENDEVETIAGIVMHELGRIPQEGDVITLAGVNRAGDKAEVLVSVLEMDGRRVDRLRIVRQEITAKGDV